MEEKYTSDIGYLLIPGDDSVVKMAFDSADTLMAYLERMKGNFRDGFTVEICGFVQAVE